MAEKMGDSVCRCGRGRDPPNGLFAFTPQTQTQQPEHGGSPGSLLPTPGAGLLLYFVHPSAFAPPQLYLIFLDSFLVYPDPSLTLPRPPVIFPDLSELFSDPLLYLPGSFRVSHPGLLVPRAFDLVCIYRVKPSLGPYLIYLDLHFALGNFSCVCIDSFLVSSKCSFVPSSHFVRWI